MTDGVSRRQFEIEQFRNSDGKACRGFKTGGGTGYSTA